MPETPQLPISDLRAELDGKVIAPDHPVYDDARRIFFSGIDRRPAAVVRAADAADVARVVRLARDARAELAVRGAGHSAAGYGTTDGGIVLDVSAMNAVEIDTGDRSAWAQAVSPPAPTPRRPRSTAWRRASVTRLPSGSLGSRWPAASAT